MARWEPRERGGVDMTHTTNARIAGFTYLFYAAIGICGDLLMRHAFGVEGDAAQLARFGEYATDVRIEILIKVLEAFSALVLAVTLYGSRATRTMSLQCWPWSVALPKACSVRSASRATWDWCGWRRPESGPVPRTSLQRMRYVRFC